VNTSRPYWNHAEHSGEIELNSASDTLYIDFEYPGEIPSESVYYRAGHSSYEIFWMDEQNRNIVMFPSIKLVRQSEAEPRAIIYKTTAFSQSYSGAVLKARERIPNLSIGDSLISVSPAIYDRTDKFDGTFHQILIYLPEGVEVKIKKPLEHNFDKIVVNEWPFEGCCLVRRR
jgi:hypothetical protein